MDQSSLISNPGSRTPSPFENTYESYENTRSNARGELLLNEYKDTAPLAPNKRPPSTKTVDIAPHTDRIISRIRLSLRLLSLCISGTVLGALSHFLSVYVKTREEWVNVQERYGQRRVWPHWVQMKPMFVLEGVAATATLCSMMLLGAMFFSAIRRVTPLSNRLTSGASVFLMCIWTAVGLYRRFSSQVHAPHSSDLTTYVCSADLHPLVLQTMGNARVLCQELRFAWWAVLLVVTVEGAVLGTVAWAVVALRRRGRYARVVYRVMDGDRVVVRD